MLETEKAPYFVNANWLSENISDPNIRILDATWFPPRTEHDLPEGVIPGARFFDLGHLKSNTPFGAAYPPAEVMKDMAENLGLTAVHHIIVYDKQGYFSAPRVWWSFKAVGHEKISVLRDGFPAWHAKNFEIASQHTEAPSKTDYKVSDSIVEGVAIEAVLEATNTDTQILDARPPNRFAGQSAEPRSGLRSGHIPGSLNLPLGDLKNTQGDILQDGALRTILEKKEIDLTKPIITSCGSGVTAAALALILRHLGADNVSVYSGSWAEYGATDHPIETS